MQLDKTEPATAYSQIIRWMVNLSVFLHASWTAPHRQSSPIAFWQQKASSFYEFPHSSNFTEIETVLFCLFGRQIFPVPVLILKLWDEMMVPCDGHSGRRPTSCFPFAFLIDLHTLIAKIAQSGIQAQARVGERLDGVGGTCSAWRKQKSYKSALAA